MGTHLHRTLGTVVIAAGLLVAPVATAADPVIGALTPAGCLSNEGTDICGADATAPGLQVPNSVVVSADGSSVYVASSLSATVSQFERDAATGALTYVGCVADPDASAVCDTEQDGLEGAYAMAMSPDDSSLYVASTLGPDVSAVVALDRSTASGILTPAGCFADDSSDAAGCTEAAGLENPNGLAVSPDGSSVYVTSFVDAAVVAFDRNASTSALTAAGCIADTESLADCDATTPGLAGAAGVAVSPDNTSVYVASHDDDSLVRFSRTPAGDLTAQPDPETGLDGAAAVTISPEGGTVLVAASDADSLVRFPRAGDGTLGARVTYTGYDGINGVSVTGDGESVYVTASTYLADGDGVVAHLDRDPVSGALTPAGCVGDTGSTTCAGTTTQGLFGVTSVAPSPDGLHAYAAGSFDDAVVIFERNTVPPAPDKVEGKAGATRHQHGPRIKVRVLAREPLTVSLRGTLKVTSKAGHTTYKLKPTSFKAPLGETYRLIGLGPKAHTRAVKKALKDGKLVVAKVRWILTDAAGNKASSRARVYLAE